MENNPSELRGGRLPVDNVSWDDAQEFIRRLNKTDSANTYRLPTEAEWEYAARAGTTTKYLHGDGDKNGYETDKLDAYVVTGILQPGGSKQPNAWGLYDMFGNVSEWVQDWYAEKYYAVSPLVDPKGPVRGERRVVRGGDYHSRGNGSFQSATRSSQEPDQTGLRLVLVPR